MSLSRPKPERKRSSEGQVHHIRMACTRCRARKGRCDGLKPSCSTCARTNAQCHYEQVSVEDSDAARRYKLELKLRRQAEAVSAASHLNASSAVTKVKAKASPTFAGASSKHSKRTTSKQGKAKVDSTQAPRIGTSRGFTGNRRRSISLSHGGEMATSAAVQLSRMLQGSDAPAAQALAHLTAQINSSAPATSLSAPNSPQLATTAHFARIGLLGNDPLEMIASSNASDSSPFGVPTQLDQLQSGPEVGCYQSHHSPSSRSMSANSPALGAAQTSLDPPMSPFSLQSHEIMSRPQLGLGLIVGPETHDWDVSMRRISLIDCHAASFYRRVSLARSAQVEGAGEHQDFAVADLGMAGPGSGSGSGGVAVAWAASSYSQLAGRRTSRALPANEGAASLSGFQAWQSWLQGSVPNDNTTLADVLRLGVPVETAFSSFGSSQDGSTPNFGVSTPGDESSSSAAALSTVSVESPQPNSSWPVEPIMTSDTRELNSYMALPRASISWTFEDVNNNVRRLSIDTAHRAGPLRYSPHDWPSARAGPDGRSPTVVPSDRLSPMFENLDFFDPSLTKSAIPSNIGAPRLSTFERCTSNLHRSASSENVTAGVRRPSILRFATQHNQDLDGAAGQPIFEMPSWGRPVKASAPPHQPEQPGPMDETYHVPSW